MLAAVVRTSVAFRLLVAVGAAAVMVIGLSQLRDAPVDVLPEFSPPMVEVQTEALGLSAVEVEQLVTSPLEADLLNGVAFLDEIRSESVAGLSSIRMFFEPGTDVLQARQLVQERLTEARALPNVSKAPAMIQPLSSTGRVMMVSLRSDQLSAIEMSVLARWKIKPRLMGVPGVANVAIFGQRERQLQVQVDPEHLRRNGVSLNQVVSTTANSLWSSPLSFVEASTPGTGGFIDTPQQRLGIQHVLPITTAADLSRVSMEGTGARRLTLGDVATVTEDHQPLIGDALGGASPTLLLVIEKFPSASTPDVTGGIEQALDALRPGLAGMELDPTVYRPASFVDQALSTLGWTALAGTVLLALVLVLLLSWRAALLSLLATSISLGAALTVLQLRGGTFNAMVLAGLVLAVVMFVDEAVVTSVHICRRLRARHDQSAATTVVRAALDIRRPLLPATAAVLLVAVPVYVVGGIDGSFLRPAVETYVLAVLLALVVAVTVTPALALTVLGEGTHRRRPPLVHLLHRGYRPVLLAAHRSATALWVGAAVVVLAAVALAPALTPDRPVPTMRERDLLVRWEAAPGISLPEMNRATAETAERLRQIDGVRSVGGHVGRAITSDQVAGVSSGELWISLRKDADHDRTLAEVRRSLAGVDGFEHDVLTYGDKRIDDLGPQVEQPVAVRVYGEDLGQLSTQAEAVERMLRGVQGVSEPRIEQAADEPTVEIEVDLARAQAFGIKPGDVRRAAATLLAGIQVGNLFEEQKVFDVVVWGTPEVRQDVDSVLNLLVDTPDGGHVRLAEVADVRLASSPAVIRHDAVSRYADVTAEVAGRDLDSVLDDVSAGLAGIDFPLEYHAEVLGDYRDREAGELRVQLVALAAAVLVLLLLQSSVGGWRVPLSVFVTLPVATSGALLAAWLLGGPLSWTTLLAVGGVFAIALRSTTVMLDHLRARTTAYGGRPRLDDVAAVAEERLVPTVASALAVMAALLPVLLAGPRAGLEVVHPMALVLVPGLVSSTVYSLVLVPLLYLVNAPETAPDALDSLGDVQLPTQVDLTQRGSPQKGLADAMP